MLQKEKRICLCNHITLSTIEKEYKKGVKTLADLIKVTKATTGCGSCFRDVYRLFLEMKYNTKGRDSQEILFNIQKK